MGHSLGCAPWGAGAAPSSVVHLPQVVQFLYRVDLSSWPEASSADVTRAVKRLHQVLAPGGRNARHGPREETRAAGPRGQW